MNKDTIIINGWNITKAINGMWVAKKGHSSVYFYTRFFAMRYAEQH